MYMIAVCTDRYIVRVIFFILCRDQFTMPGGLVIFNLKTSYHMHISVSWSFHKLIK